MGLGDRQLHPLIQDAARTPVDRAAARGLVSLLLDPYAPTALASGLQDILQEPWSERVARHLGFGMIDEALDLRDDFARTALTRRMFRRLETNSTVLQGPADSLRFCGSVESTFERLYQGYLATDEILTSSELSSGVVTCLVEQLLISFASHYDLMLSLLQFRFLFSSHPRRNHFAARVREAIAAAQQQEPNREALVVCDLSAPIPFRQTLLADESFRATIERFDEVLAELTRSPGNPKRSLD